MMNNNEQDAPVKLREFFRACNALHLEVSPAIAEDVRQKGIDAVREEHDAMQKLLDAAEIELQQTAETIEEMEQDFAERLRETEYQAKQIGFEAGRRGGYYP